MHVFIAGICGTFMAGIAQIARQSGYHVTGCDEHVYPPMSTLLTDLGIDIGTGYLATHLPSNEVPVIIGNALSRDNALVEATLDQRHEYVSGPEWLKQHVLRKRMVLAVAGTHGKTTTSSMLTWILHYSGLQPGFLIGGKPGNFDRSAELGSGPQFVIEADEYDTAFFDKRSKFVHYLPTVAVLNNLEFDHADIFADIDQIKTQFHHLLRIVPQNGSVVVNQDDSNLADVINMGCWSQLIPYSIKSEDSMWFARAVRDDHSEFEVVQHGQVVGAVNWNGFGRHNMANGLAAIAAASTCGVTATQACEALNTFLHADRRLQLRFNSKHTMLYEDFAHHPTAIKETIRAIRSRHPDMHLIVVVEPRSNTMRMGVHGDSLQLSLQSADNALVYQSTPAGKAAPKPIPGLKNLSNKEALLAAIKLSRTGNDVIILMSNGGFDNVPLELTTMLEAE